MTERTGFYLVSCLSLLGWQVPSFSVFTLIPQRGPLPFWTGLCQPASWSGSQGMSLLLGSVSPPPPCTPLCLALLGPPRPPRVRFCGAPHILGYLTHSASSPKIPAKSGIPPSEELAVPRTPSASPPSDSDSREDKVRGSLCLIVSPTCWQNS